jgi:hypothetical protein
MTFMHSVKHMREIKSGAPVKGHRELNINLCAQWELHLPTRPVQVNWNWFLAADDLPFRSANAHTKNETATTLAAVINRHDEHVCNQRIRT